MAKQKILVSLFLVICSLNIVARNTIVASVSAFNTALSTATPGDTITLANQTWTDAAIMFAGKSGTAQLPIVLRAQTYGNVILTGASYVKMYGQYLKVEGLVFKNVVLTSGGIVEFRSSSSTLASNCRLSRCAFVNCNPTLATTNYNWVQMYGTYNRVDHCYFRGKNHAGPTLAVVRNAHVADYHLIDSNYFAFRPDLGVNGGETIRIGTSTYSLSASRTIVEYNYFERCNGEIETISVKSCENHIRYNTFYENSGTITLRHGHRCLVYGNFFFGNRATGTGGIRIIGQDHLIFNNYISGTTGDDTRSALSIMDGTLITDTTNPAQLTEYFPVKRAKILFNTLVDCKYNVAMGAGRSTTEIIKPDSVIFANNILRSVSGNITAPMILQVDTATNMTWQGNFVSSVTVGVSPLPAGIVTTDPRLSLGSDGIYRPLSISPCINAAQGNYPDVTIDMDGQAREILKDAGADEYLTGSVLIKPVNAGDTGPGNVSLASGNWSDTLTWLYNAVPTANDDVRISAGNSVTINVNNAVCRNLTVDGTLSYSNSTSTRSLVINADITINASGIFSAPAKASSGTELLHTLTIYGNLTNKGTFDMRGGSGTTAGSNTINAVNITFAGSGNSNVSMGLYSSSNNEFNGITVNKSSGAKVILLGDVFLNSAGTVNPPNITLTSGLVETGQYKLVLLSNGATVSNGSAASYINGAFGRAFPSGGGSKSFPVGDAGNFRPVSVATATTGIVSGHYLLVTALKQPANNGTSTFSGGIDFVSNVRHFRITYMKNTSTTLSLSFNSFSVSYGTDDKLVNGSTGFRVAYSPDNRSSWVNAGPSTHTINLSSPPVTIQSDVIFSGLPVLGDSASIYLAVGKIEGNSGFETPLRVNAIPQGLIDGNTIINDTLSVEIHSASAPFALCASSRALSNSGETRFTTLRLPVPGAGYLVLRSRNILETWSSSAQNFSQDSVSYDFTQSQTSAYGSNLLSVSGRWCLYSGDINQDGIIDFSDVLMVDNDQLNFTSGYVPTDLTGDNFVDFSDLVIADNNSINFVMVQRPGEKAIPSRLERREKQ